jgi:putative ABC transport system permease protein
MLRDFFLLALQGLKHRGVRSWLTMLGIFIGIAAVVSLISLGQGLQQAITGQFSTLGPDRLIVENAGTGFGPPGSTAIAKLTKHDVDIIKRVQGVESAIPRLLRVVKVEYNKIASFEFAVSMPPDQEDIDIIYDTFNMKAAQGRLLEAGDKGKIVLGSDIVENDAFDKPLRVGTHVLIQGKSFEIIGILEKVSSFQINSAIFMQEDDLKDILSLGDEIDLIAIKAVSEKETERVAQDIERELRKDRREKEGEEDFSVQTPVQALQSVNTILNIINLIVAGIAAISLVVGGVGITNTMYTSVLERTKEIGIMKAIGAKNGDVMSIFLFESGLLGLVGGVVGAVIGIGLAFGISAILKSFVGALSLDVTISLPLLLGAIGFSLIIGTISGVFPALQASRLKTVETLRR